METLLALTLYFVQKKTPVSSFWLDNGLTYRSVSRMLQFNAFYDEVSAVVFSKERPDRLMFSEALKSPQLFKSRLIIMLLETVSDEALIAAESLNRNNIPVVIYLVSDAPEASSLTSPLPMTEIHLLSSEADLKEVL